MPISSISELTRRSHSLRNFEAEEFIQAWNMAETEGERQQVRAAMDFIEAGRFSDMLRQTFSMMVHLDLDELEQFAEDNPWLIRWVQVWATIEEVRRFDDFVPPKFQP